MSNNIRIIATISTVSVDADTCGTIFELKAVVPNIFLYPPAISGSKLVSCKASPGRMEKISLFKTNPPKQLTTVGAICDVFGITY